MRVFVLHGFDARQWMTARFAQEPHHREHGLRKRTEKTFKKSLWASRTPRNADEASRAAVPEGYSALRGERGT